MKEEVHSSYQHTFSGATSTIAQYISQGCRQRRFFGYHQSGFHFAVIFPSYGITIDESLFSTLFPFEDRMRSKRGCQIFSSVPIALAPFSDACASLLLCVIETFISVIDNIDILQSSTQDFRSRLILPIYVYTIIYPGLIVPLIISSVSMRIPSFLC